HGGGEAAAAAVAAAGGGVNGGDGAGDVDGEEVVMWQRGLMAV
nr:hypothetical protein [Tanacetum cinerariifolium]